MLNSNVVIIIPTYNESAIIEKTLVDVFEAATTIKDWQISVLVFDSASTDNTASIVKALQSTYPKLLLRSEVRKTGLGSAYHQAMRIALDELSADVVFEFDADLSHQPCYIAPMLEHIKNADVVVGSRYVSGGEIPNNWGLHRKTLSMAGNWIARTVLTYRYKDFTSGFRATRRDALQEALPDKFLSSQYAYKLELLWRLHKNKAQICELPITFVDRTEGESKLPTNSIGDALRVIFTLRYYELKRYIKMCIVGVSGATVQFLLYNVLSQMMSPFSATQWAVSAAILNNYILNNRFTFKDKNETEKKQKVKIWAFFLVYSVFIIQLQSYWIELGISLFGRGAIKENLLLLCGVGLGSILNYFVYSRVVWRNTIS